MSKEKLKYNEAGGYIFGSLFMNLIPSSNVLKYDLTPFGAIQEETNFICTSYAFGLASFYMKDMVGEDKIDKLFDDALEEMNEAFNGQLKSKIGKYKRCFLAAKDHMLYSPAESGTEVFDEKFVKQYILDLLNNNTNYPQDLLGIAKKDLNVYLMASKSFFDKVEII